ncbi:MAG TPA: ATP-binding protein, partial [Solirubrobacteraceae bacterium]|nr:ATP-binding protein [Solirubrobacteraceae bacterium]
TAPVTLAPLDTAPRTARASVTAQLSAWGRGDLADDAGLIVSELMTNAVVASEAGETPVAVRLLLTPASVVVEVYDRAPGFPLLAAAGAEAEAGRGLQIVASVATRWGWTPTTTGKCT